MSGKGLPAFAGLDEATWQPTRRESRVLGAAAVSDCQLYRYWLGRRWDQSLPMGVLLGINPSTAGARDDDHTTIKFQGFTRRWGWGGYYLGNQFAFRATDQRELLRADDPVGPHNDVVLQELLQQGSRIVVAWGSAKTRAVRRLLDARLQNMAPLLRTRPLYCLGVTTDGSPCHPLMLSYDRELQLWCGPNVGAFTRC